MMTLGTGAPPIPWCSIRSRCASVKSGWSNKLVKKYGAPPPVLRSSEIMRSRTTAGSHRSTGERPPTVDRYQKRAQHADGMTDRVRHQLRPGRRMRRGAELLDLGAHRLMGMDDAFRDGGRSRSPSDECGRRRVNVRRRVERIFVKEVGEAGTALGHLLVDYDQLISGDPAIDSRFARKSWCPNRDAVTWTFGRHWSRM